MDSDTEFDEDFLMMMGDMSGMRPAPGDELVGRMPTSVNRSNILTLSEESKEEIQEHSSRMEMRAATTSFGKGTHVENSYTSNHTTEINSSNYHDSSNSNNLTMASTHEQRPGAYAVPTRAQGARPVWHRRVSAHLVAPFRRSSGNHGSRRQRRSRARDSSSSAGGTIGRVSIFGFNRTSQSNLPPEMRRARTSILDALFRSPSQNSTQNSGERQYVTADCQPATKKESKQKDDELDDDFAGDVRVGLILLCLIFALLAVAAAGLVLLLGNFNTTSMPDSNTSPPTPSPSIVGISERQQDLQGKLAHLSIDGEDVFADDQSPQFRAVQWLADEYPVPVNELSQQRLETRYALATFYFSMNFGIVDSCGFVSELHECYWNCNVTGSPGVVCDENLQVTDLIFGKKYTTYLIILKGTKCLWIQKKIHIRN